MAGSPGGNGILERIEVHNHKVDGADGVFAPVGALAGLAALFYVFCLTGCVTVGYVFTDRVAAAQWRRGLNASSVLLGLFLSVPTLVSLFYPSVTGAMLWVAASLYVLSRIAYIAKGFRIFYNNFPSLLYFILYLCSLEIIPLIIISNAATFLLFNLQGTP